MSLTTSDRDAERHMSNAECAAHADLSPTGTFVGLTRERWLAAPEPPSMGMLHLRDELAMRVFCALLTNGGYQRDGEHIYRRAWVLADEMLADREPSRGKSWG